MQNAVTLGVVYIYIYIEHFTKKYKINNKNE